MRAVDGIENRSRNVLSERRRAVAWLMSRLLAGAWIALNSSKSRDFKSVPEVCVCSGRPD